MVGLILPVIILGLIRGGTGAAVAAQSGSGGGGGVADDAARVFDPLLGTWQTAVSVRLPDGTHQPLPGTGTWTFRPVFGDRVVVDEFALHDDAGAPVVLILTVRMYDAVRHRWTGTVTDALTQETEAFAGVVRGGQFTAHAGGRDGNGEYTARARFERIDASTFIWSQDRSYDGGQTWIDRFAVVSGTRGR